MVVKLNVVNPVTSGNAHAIGCNRPPRGLLATHLVHCVQHQPRVVLCRNSSTETQEATSEATKTDGDAAKGDEKPETTSPRKARKVSLRPASQQELQLALKRQKQLEAAVAKAAAIRSRVRRLGGGSEPAPGSVAVAGPGVTATSSGGATVPAGTATVGGSANQGATSGGRPAATRTAVGAGIMKDFSNSAADQQLSLLEAKKKSMEILEKIRAKHRKIQEMGGPIVNSGPRLVDIRMFEQMAASRNRLSSKLSEANQYAKWLETQVDDKNTELAQCYDAISALALEVGNVSRLAQNAAAAVRYSVDKGEPEEKLMQVSERMQVLQKVMHEKLDVLNKAVLREVPLTWYGVATEVRVMGDFDDWTMGVWLSCDSSAEDGTMVTYEGKLYVPPGKYKIKFLVDGEWKGAPNWPVEKDFETGEDNNILIVQ